MRKAAATIPFRWLTPASGHQWKRLKGVMRLVPKSGGSRWIDPKAAGGVWIYAPPPGLFRKFARLKIGKDEVRQREILAFADEYGDIMAQPQEGGLSLSTEVQVIRKHATMETWYGAIRHMRRTVDLWDRLNDSEEREARPLPEDLRLEIKRALTDTETPSCSTLTLTANMRLVVYPVNLLAYMWLTFARVVSGEIEERPCKMFETCHEYVYVGRGTGLQRADTDTCGSACRKQKSREKD